MCMYVYLQTRRLKYVVVGGAIIYVHMCNPFTYYRISFQS